MNLSDARPLVRWLLVLVATATMSFTPVWAQTTPDASSTQQQIDRLLKKIEDLEASQKQMQKVIDQYAAGAPAMAPKPAPSPAPVPQAPPVDAGDSTQADTPPAQEMHILGPVQFSGFTDFGYGRALFENLPPSGLQGSPNGLGLGDFDLFTNTRIADRWSLLAEVLVTSDFTNQFGAEIDRLFVSYKPSDYFNISVGKFNTAIGYYPNAFHRARYFQIATGRPMMYSDEDSGGILPVHSIGVSTTGKIKSGSLGLHWVAELSNGTASTPGAFPIQNFADENNGKAVDFALYARPDWLPGLEVGASAYHDTLHPVTIAGVHQLITAAHVVYDVSKFEWLNEAAIIRHSLDGTDRVARSLTSYTELSRAFGGTRPYFRFDYQNVPRTDPIFSLLARRSGPSVGVTRRLSNYVVLKVQYGRLGQRDLRSTNDFQAQLAIAF